MIKPTFIISDLHLTDDFDYRWNVFQWVIEQHKENPFEYLYILGDLTEKKDNHSGVLTNALVEHIARLTELCDIRILMGNHDYTDNAAPFFKFLNYFLPSVLFINVPYFDPTTEDLWLPHSKNPSVDWKDIEEIKTAKHIFLHQAMNGVTLPNGTVLKGMDMSFFKKAKKCQGVFSGDIHTPQDFGAVTYVGAIHPVVFGDTYTGRALLFEDDEIYEMENDTAPRKWTFQISKPEQLKEHKEIRKGDFLAIKFILDVGDSNKFKAFKQEALKWAEQKGIICNSNNVTMQCLQVAQKASKLKVKAHENKAPEKIVDDYLKVNNIDDEDYKKIGKELVKK